MARSAFIVGGTGQIGRAAARRLAAAGWEVTVAARAHADVPGARTVTLDRAEGLRLREDVDAVVDCVAFSPGDAEQLLGLAGRVGTVVAVSSASVYADDAGRTLDEARDEADFPRFAGPIAETQETVEPGDDGYSARKAAIERALLEQDAVPATVLRPCAVHGPHAKSHVRERYFVQRALDGRRRVLLAYRGESRFHTTSVDNLAELIRLACERPATRVLNAGDPGPPDVRGIARAVGAVLEHAFEEVPLDGRPEAARNPWAAPHPFVLDMSAAEVELGYRPVTSYADAVGATVRWLLEERPPLDPYMATFFDYDSEDVFLAEHAAKR